MGFMTNFGQLSVGPMVPVIGLVWVLACSSEPQEPNQANTTGDERSESTGAGTANAVSSRNDASTSSSHASTMATGAETSSARNNPGQTSGARVFEAQELWSGLTYPCSLRDGGEHVLTCDRRQYLGQPSRVLMLPKGGGNPVTLAELQSADSVAVNEAIWALDSSNGQILRLDRNSGETLERFEAPSYTSGLFAAPNGIFATSTMGLDWFAAYGIRRTVWRGDADEEPWLLAVDTSALYLTVNPPYPAPRGTSYRVLRLNVDPQTGRAQGETLELASGVGSAKGIALTSGAVVFADNHNDQLYTVPLDGGEKTLLANVPHPWSVATSATHAYVASRPEDCTSEGAVYQVSLTGGEVETLATGQVCPSNILVTGSEVYWLNAGPEQPKGDPPAVSGSYAAIMRFALLIFPRFRATHVPATERGKGSFRGRECCL